MIREIWKANYRLILCAAAGLVSGAVFGFLLRPQILPESTEQVAEVGHIGQINILPDTQIQCSYRFSGCEHTIERAIDALPYVGQTQNDFLIEFKDAEILSFSSDTVQLRRLRLGPCPQHIMLRADETGQLIVYQTAEDSLEVVGMQTLPIYAAAFPQEISEELYEGIVFESIDEVNEYLENAES